MKDKINELVSKVVNPKTGKTLGEEKRIREISFSNDDLLVTYDREGIAPDVKRTIEDQIYKSLDKIIDSKKISVMTVSKDSKDVLAGGQMPQKGAELKVGHGQIAPKKSISGVKQVIAIASGKGGVGKSTVSVNLALALRNKGFKVGILDADIYGPSIPMLLNSRNKKPLATKSGKIAPMTALDLSFISFGLFIGEDDPVIWRGPMLGGVLNQFLFDVDWGELDFLIIDLPPGTGDIQLSLLQATQVDGAIVVSTPQDVALLDARKGLVMFNKMNTPVLGMIENMSSFICDQCDKEHFIFGAGGVLRATNDLGTNYLGGIPIELDLRIGSDEGTPFMANQEFKDRPAYRAYMNIGEKIITHLKSL